MTTLPNGRSPHSIGVPPMPRLEIYETLIEHVSGAANGRLLSEYADTEYGTLVRLTPEEQKRFQLKPGQTAAVCWTETRDKEPGCSVLILTDKEAELLLESYESIIVRRVIEHYRANPADDGHPAYGLYKHYNERIEQNLAVLGAHANTGEARTSATA